MLLYDYKGIEKSSEKKLEGLVGADV